MEYYTVYLELENSNIWYLFGHKIHLLKQKFKKNDQKYQQCINEDVFF